MGKEDIQYRPEAWWYENNRLMDLMYRLEQEKEVRISGTSLVLIPRIEGRVTTRQAGADGTRYVEYILESWYDPEKKQMRNRKARIGQVLEVFPVAMIPTEQYYQYFDRRTGKPRDPEERKVIEENRKDFLQDFQNSSGSETGRSETVEQHKGTRDQERDKTAETVQNNMPKARNHQEEVTGMNKTQKLIQSVLEKEGLIGRETDPVLESRTDNTRIRVLLDLLRSMREVIRDYAMKHPREVVPPFQVKKINKVLEEIRELEEKNGSGLQDMLEVLEEPIEEEDKNGNIILRGMTYSDALMVMEYYNSVTFYARLDW